MTATVRARIDGWQPGEPLPDGTTVPLAHLPRALARVHWATAPGTKVMFDICQRDEDPGTGLGPFPGLRALLAGAGFQPAQPDDHGSPLTVWAVRARSLPDTVGPGMRALVCGLNPSEYAADRGVGYARPGNRFWPAALTAGLVTRTHDPVHALDWHGVGMTDLVKRASPGATSLTRGEYRSGAMRVERLVDWLRPRVVCFVGLEGWRAAVDGSARPGLQSRPFGGRPAYVMPSTSGRNAHSSLDDLTAHLRAVVDLAGGAITE